MNDPPSRPRTPRRHHRDMLAAACLVAALAFLLQVLPDGRVAFRGLSRYPLPPSCAIRAWLGTDCPGCGLTRSIVHLAHADWHASLRAHRLGWLFAIAILAQIPYRAFALRHPDRPLEGPSPSALIGILLALLLLANWIALRLSNGG